MSVHPVVQHHLPHHAFPHTVAHAHYSAPVVVDAPHTVYHPGSLHHVVEHPVYTVKPDNPQKLHEVKASKYHHAATHDRYVSPIDVGSHFTGQLVERKAHPLASPHRASRDAAATAGWMTQFEGHELGHHPTYMVHQPPKVGEGHDYFAGHHAPHAVAAVPAHAHAVVDTHADLYPAVGDSYATYAAPHAPVHAIDADYYPHQPVYADPGFNEYVSYGDDGHYYSRPVAHHYQDYNAAPVPKSEENPIFAHSYAQTHSVDYEREPAVHTYSHV